MNWGRYLIVVCNSTAIIGLAKIGRLNLLEQIYKEIYIPEAVFFEVANKDKPGSDEIENAKWIKRETVKDTRTVEFLIAEFGLGEAEALVLGKELNADLLILDDEKARTAAISAGFRIIGLVGILLLAKHLGLIPLIKPLLEELRSKKFRLGDRIIQEILEKAGEN